MTREEKDEIMQARATMRTPGWRHIEALIETKKQKAFNIMLNGQNKYKRDDGRVQYKTIEELQKDLTYILEYKGE